MNPLKTPPVIPSSVNTAQFIPWPICELGSMPKQIGHAVASDGISVKLIAAKIDGTINLQDIPVLLHSNLSTFSYE